MAHPLFRPGRSVWLLVTVLWLWHGGSAVLGQVPSPVSNLNVTGKNETSLTLQWTPPSDTNAANYAYVVSWSQSGSVRNQTFPPAAPVGSRQTAVITSLDPGTPYNISVYSVTPNKTESTAATLTDATTMPSPVSNLKVTVKNETSLTLQWTVPNDTLQDSYVYLVRLDPGVSILNVTFQSRLPGGSNQTEVISSLDPGVPYNVSVNTVTTNKVESTAATIIDATTVPSPVSYLKVSNRNETSLTLQWTVPNNTLQSEYRYLVRVGPKGSLLNATFPSRGPSGSNQTEVIAKLDPGVAYNLAVYSVTANGVESTATLVSNATTMPSPVSYLKVSNRNETSLTLQWTVPNNTLQSEYRYLVRVGPKGSLLNATFPSKGPSGSNQTEVIAKLDPGVAYNLAVYSVTANGVESTATPVSNATTMPSPVSNLKVSNRNETSLTLQWTVPNNTLQSEYRYLVRVGPKGSLLNATFPSKGPSGSNQTEVIANLYPGVAYNLAVYTITANGVESTATLVSNATTMPSPVSYLKVSNRNETSLTLQWTVPNNTLQSEYRYLVRVGPKGSLLNATFPSKGSSGSNQTEVIAKLDPGVPYNLAVYSVTGNGVESTATPVSNATTMPSPVSYLKVSNRNETSLTLQWTVPNNTLQSEYRYLVRVGPKGSLLNATFPSKGSSGSNQTEVIAKLDPGVPYNLAVYSVTANGVESTATPISNATTMPSPVTNFRVINQNETSLTLQWRVPNNTLQSSYSYLVEWISMYTGRNMTFPSRNNLAGDQTEVILNLDPGVPYNLSVYSVTPNNVMSIPSTITDATTMPSPVSNLMVTTKNETSLTLQWTVSSNKPESSYSYFVLVASVASQTNRTFASNASAGGNQAVVITDLDPGVPYNLTVYSVTSNQVRSTAATLAGATTMPSPVSNLMVTTKNETSLTLQWTVSSNKLVSSYSYLVMVASMGSQTNRTFASSASAGDNQTVMITGLDPGVPYNLTVYSVTSNQVRSSATTLAGATTMPSPVTNLMVTTKNETSLTLQWTVSSNKPESSYSYFVLVASVASQSNRTFASNASAGGNQTVMITGLDPGVPYNLTVYSVTSNQVRSIATTLAGATTNPSPVSDVSLVSRLNSSITITWKVPANLYVENYTYLVTVATNVSTISNSTVKENISTAALLNPGTLYIFTIQSVTMNNTLSTGTPYSAYSVPNQPENLVATPFNDTAILVNWTAPRDPNVQSYKYTVSLNNTQNYHALQAVTAGTSLSIGSLYPGNPYTVIVTTVINNTSSTESRIFALTNPQTASSIKDVVVTNTTATFAWDFSPMANSELAGFLISVIPDSGKAVNVTLLPLARDHVVGNLTPGMNYTFEFRSFANSTYKLAAASGSRRRRQADPFIVTYSPANVQRALTDPGTIDGVKCETVSGGYSLGLEWTCPQGNFTKFQVLVNGEVKMATDTCNSVTLTGLQAAYKYTILVRTISGSKSADSISVTCSTDATGVIVGSIFGVLLFLALLALLFFLVLKYRRTKETSSRGFSMKKVPGIVSVDKFPSYFRQQHSDSDFGFAEEYQLLASVGTDQGHTAAQHPDNKSKNRYTNVLPYDISRVKLCNLPGIPNSDYINANYMPGFNSNKEFIASQGPLPNTLGDFWRMVWEHRVGTMVMLTNCTEGGKLKCEHYWPLDYTPCTYDDITVTVTSETILPQWTTREFTLRHAKEAGIRYVSHFHYTVWPDHGVPDETATVIKFRNMVRAHMNQRTNNGPAVVHCSAGVGRTGTLIALDTLMQQVENEKQVGVFSFIKKMRMNRPFMVQTESQYVFLNHCIKDVIESPLAETENIYENQFGSDLIYENIGAVNHYGNANGRLA
ncbi:receptor-type tyrosine-protein phosphatase H isoform X2 [Ambystoma mexicanum]|uniref:receptor-type tyrosine-protein phosphatase H isoform X2 n=1 Tax=Ambystoma mexicanum TaxID=8296 RepID=UPI0037E77CEF